MTRQPIILAMLAFEDEGEVITLVTSMRSPLDSGMWASTEAWWK